MPECVLCNAAPGEQYQLVLEESRTIDVALCEICCNDLLAESWIGCNRTSNSGATNT